MEKLKAIFNKIKSFFSLFTIFAESHEKFVLGPAIGASIYLYFFGPKLFDPFIFSFGAAYWLFKIYTNRTVHARMTQAQTLQTSQTSGTTNG